MDMRFTGIYNHLRFEAPHNNRGVAKVVMMASNRQAANKQTLNNWFDALTEFYKKMWATQY